MKTLLFFIKRDLKDNVPLWVAPLLLFTLLFAISFLWRAHQLSNHAALIGLQLCVFLFIFVSATLYGKYLNSVVGTSLHVRTQMSLTRNYLFSLPIRRSTLFWCNQVRLLLPLFPFVILATAFVVTFNPIISKITVVGLFLVGVCLSWLILNYFSWLCYLVERSFENRDFSHAFKGFFLANPFYLLIVYFLFLRQVPELVNGLTWAFVPAFLAPAMMLGLNYRNWLRRE